MSPETNKWFCRACGCDEHDCECLDDGMPEGDVTGCEEVDAGDVFDIEYDR